MRHEELNKQAQNMFPGKSLEELDLACCIVDDVKQLRNQALNNIAISEREDHIIVVPDYTILVTTIRYGIRKKNYLSTLMVASAAHTIDDIQMHDTLENIFDTARQ